MKKLTLLVMCAGAAAGCVTTSHVVQTAKDTYMVQASNDACGNCAPPQIRAAERANEYCSAQGKVVLVRTEADETFDIGFGKKKTLTFSCLDANDPEYARK